MKQIGLLSDTHGYIDQRILHHLSDCHEIWHAGDIGSADVTNQLEKIAILRAVYGNIDGGSLRKSFPENQLFEVEGLRIWITHIAGRPGSYVTHIRESMKIHQPHIFVCGHSHILLVQKDEKSGRIHMNPGAAGRHGFHKVRTLLKFKIDSGKISDLQAVELGSRATD